MLKNIVNASRGIIISLGILMTSYLPNAYAFDEACFQCLEPCYNKIENESSEKGCMVNGLKCAANCKFNDGSAACQNQIDQFKTRAKNLCEDAQ